MIFYIIPTVIIIASAAVIIRLVYKKLPNLAAINIESIAEEKVANVTNRIMIERLSRKAAAIKKITLDVLRPILQDLKIFSREFYQKIIDLEKNYLKPQPLKRIEVNFAVKEQLAAVSKLMAESNFVQAEEACFQIIRLDAKNPEVYKILAGLYLETKEYKKARETGRYLLKLLSRLFDREDSGENRHLLANGYTDLGWIYQLENKPGLALANYQKAVELEPGNPRFLDLLLKISIILKDKKLASRAFSSLKEADPDNQKLAALKEEITSLPEKESKRQYNAPL